jgi:hypothetical protein
MTKLKALSVLECREYVLDTFGPGCPRAHLSRNERDRTRTSLLEAADGVRLNHCLTRLRWTESYNPFP